MKVRYDLASVCLIILLVSASCSSGDELVSGPTAGVDTGVSDAQLLDTAPLDSASADGEALNDGGADETVDVMVTDLVDGETSDVLDDTFGDVESDSVDISSDATSTCPGGVGCDCVEDVDCDDGTCVKGYCGVPGCTPTSPADEACNGVDDDCDGQTDEGSCDDGEICTDDLCDGSVCSFPPKQAPCDADNNACTEDQCTDGNCKATSTKTCDDNNPCTTDSCDPQSGNCINLPEQGTLTCDDGSACTNDDACAQGQCLGSLVDCNDDNPCTNDGCDPTSGCQNTPSAGPCDDGDACTNGDDCDATKGSCESGSKKDCDDSDPCTQDSCDALIGTCVNGAVSGPCDDGNACSTNDACGTEGCVGNAITCDDSSTCTKDSCDPKAGCVYTNLTGSCDDGNPCTVFDTCLGSKCVGLDAAQNCDDNNACTKDSCDSTTGCVNLPIEATCTDGDSCTEDKCQQGKCVNVKWTCGCKSDAECTAQDDTDVCNGKLKCVLDKGIGVCKVDPLSIINCDTSKDGPCVKTSCEPKTGACVGKPAPNGTKCDADGSLCTVGDSCNEGLCKAGQSLACDDNNSCTNDACDSNKGCVYSANTTPCDADGDACTVGDSCKDKLCIKGKAKVCDDGKPCTKDTCNSKTGSCGIDNKGLDGQGCDADGSICTQGDSCVKGVCVAGKPADCNDNNPCTDDQCTPKAGCVYSPNSAPCDADGDPCTASDTCSAKACKAGPAKACDDGNKCTKDSCVGATGACKHEVIVGCGGACKIDQHCEDNNVRTSDVCKAGKCVWSPASGPCDDGNKCTDKDSCGNSVCTGLKKVCDDANPCTNDGCLPGTGCVHLDNAAPCDDFDQCTLSDTCAKGKCSAGVTKPCDDGDKCTTNQCNPATGACVFKGIPGCGGYCTTVSDCDDNNPCTTESCNQGKCSSVVNQATCDDGSQCTTGDSCKDGKCVSGKAKVCDDKDPCTVDGCDPSNAACTTKPAAEGTACDDDNKCTAKDSCAKSNSGLKCQGTVGTCDDGNSCTNDSCDSKTGKCTNAAKTGPCDDGNKCTAGDSCIGGVCVAVKEVVVATVAGAGKGYKEGNPAQFNTPFGVAIRGDSLVVSDSYNHRIRLIAKDGSTSVLAGSGQAGLLNGKGAKAWFN
ncbi:MAG: hypothetical protein CMH53_05120, partial [Myxococcales bacterium]|nr:hypothetical protein [Myxococcales bacterium]